jgi:hypothetical protein
MSSLSNPVPLLARHAWRQWWLQHRAMPAAYDLRVEHDTLPGRRAVGRDAHQPCESLCLGRGGARVASLRAHQMLRVTCTTGTVWLTCEGDALDHVLEAGDEHLAGPGDALVLLGMPSAAVLITTR